MCLRWLHMQLSLTISGILGSITSLKGRPKVSLWPMMTASHSGWLVILAELNLVQYIFPDTLQIRQIIKTNGQISDGGFALSCLRILANADTPRIRFRWPSKNSLSVRLVDGLKRRPIPLITKSLSIRSRIWLRTFRPGA